MDIEDDDPDHFYISKRDEKSSAAATSDDAGVIDLGAALERLYELDEILKKTSLPKKGRRKVYKLVARDQGIQETTELESEKARGIGEHVQGKKEETARNDSAAQASEIKSFEDKERHNSQVKSLEYGGKACSSEWRGCKDKEAMKQLQEKQDATLCEIENERPELSVKMQEIDTLHTAAVQQVREREQFEEIREQKEQHQKKLKSTLDETIHEPSKHAKNGEVRHQRTTA